MSAHSLLGALVGVGASLQVSWAQIPAPTTTTVSGATGQIVVTPESPYEATDSVVHYSVTPGSAVLLDQPPGRSAFRVLSNPPAFATSDLISITIRGVNLPALPSGAESAEYYVSLRVDDAGTRYAFVPLSSCPGSCLSTGRFIEERGTPISGTTPSSPGPINSTAFPSKGFAAAIPSSGDVTIGFFLSDLCSVAQSQGLSPSVCSGAAAATVSPGTSQQVRLQVHVGAAGDASTNTFTPEPEFPTTLSTTYTIVLHNSPPTNVSCNLVNSYVPRSGAISIFPSNFSLSVESGGAPAQAVVVVGNAAPLSPVVSDSFASIGFNGIQGRASVTEVAQDVSGLVNSTPDSDVFYNLAISVRDASGIVAPFNLSTCQLTNVQTAEIDGFLADGNCFVASAAYGERDNLALTTLRAFRDRVLRASSVGRWATRAYYRYSPMAARALGAEPVARVVVLKALAPVVLLAQLILVAPGVLVGLALAGLGIVVWAVSPRLRLRRGRVRGVLWLALTGALMELAGDGPQSAWAQAPTGDSRTPYLDQLQQEVEVPPRPSYIEQRRRQMESDPEASGQAPLPNYIDSLRREDPTLSAPREDPDPSAPSYLSREREKLAPKPPQSPILAYRRREPGRSFKPPGLIRQGFGLRLSTAGIRDYTVDQDLGTGRVFQDIYPAKWVPDFTLVYDYKLLTREDVGSVGVQFTQGLAVHRGFGRYAKALRQGWPGGGVFAEQSDVRLSFMTIPTTLGAKFQLSALKWLQLYGQAGLASVIFWETRRDSARDLRVIAIGSMLGGGVLIPLGWLSTPSRVELYNSFGIKAFYLNIDFTRLATLGSGGVALNSNQFSAGLSFEL